MSRISAASLGGAVYACLSMLGVLTMRPTLPSHPVLTGEVRVPPRVSGYMPPAGSRYTRLHAFAPVYLVGEPINELGDGLRKTS